MSVHCGRRGRTTRRNGNERGTSEFRRTEIRGRSAGRRLGWRSQADSTSATKIRVTLNVTPPWQIFGSATMYCPSSTRRGGGTMLRFLPFMMDSRYRQPAADSSRFSPHQTESTRLQGTTPPPLRRRHGPRPRFVGAARATSYFYDPNPARFRKPLRWQFKQIYDHKKVRNI